MTPVPEKSYLGEWSKREAEVAAACAGEIFDALPKSRKFPHIGRLNELLIFISEAKKHAPDVK